MDVPVALVAAVARDTDHLRGPLRPKVIQFKTPVYQRFGREVTIELRYVPADASRCFGVVPYGTTRVKYGYAAIPIW